MQHGRRIRVMDGIIKTEVQQQHIFLPGQMKKGGTGVEIYDTGRGAIVVFVYFNIIFKPSFTSEKCETNS